MIHKKSVYRSIFNHSDVIGQQSCRIRFKKRKIRVIKTLKVTQVRENGRWLLKAATHASTCWTQLSPSPTGTVLIKLSLLGVTAEALRANIYWKSATSLNGINRKPVCHFPLVIITNWHPIYRTVWKLSQLIVQIWKLCVFESHLGGGVGTTYDVHFRLIGKRVMDVLLVSIELFARCYGGGATSKNK